MATVNEKLTAIADAIRDKTGETDALTLDDMASGVTRVYDAGKQAQSDEFWDSFQDKGQRKNYRNAFAWWSCEEIKPKHKVVATAATAMFQGAKKMKRIDKNSFDLSQASYTSSGSTSATVSFCEYCNKLEMFPDIGLQAGYYSATFADNYLLHTIEVLRYAEDVLTTSTCFRSCEELENLTIEGVIGRNFPISYSPLTVESLKSVITHLKDYAGTTSEYTYTVTFKTSAFEALEEEGATSPNNNTWAEYIDDLKWNLTLA